MKKIDTNVEIIRTHTFLPLYIRKAEIEINVGYEDEVEKHFPLFSNEEAYQTAKHNRNSLHKPILLIDEKV
jgi:hypothetical protein